VTRRKTDPEGGVGGAEYGKGFYEGRDDRTRGSAEAVVSILLELAEFHSAIDVGCGVGTWLSVLRKRGVADVLGIEGRWVAESPLEIPIENMKFLDLAIMDVPVTRRFDLALSLEVAEHLPESRAVGFVQTLTRLAPVVLFSAAIPHQGGRGHRNEQWPSYWANLFRRYDYVAVDAIRRRVWNDRNVIAWYAQNVLLFVSSTHLAKEPRLAAERERTTDDQLAIVHPTLYERNSDPRSVTLREALSILPFATRRALRRRLFGP
jgi:2-polyprenyl-3-methyl-5-hydroxy-6-metoxy-1,4-benzoquinol methylase